MRFRLAPLIVFFSSAAVLVVEIAAGRLMAPYVGVSLETFTAIIGVVLAGIAVGSAVGGHLADRVDPRRLLGVALALGGVLTWLSVPIVGALGPEFGDGAIATVLLACAAFLAPATALSATTPIVAKLKLATLEETGSVFGNLSAAGTAGALLGTFVTGFILVAAIGTRAILFAVGALLTVAGGAVHWYLHRQRPAVGMAVIAVIAVSGAGVFSVGQPCEYETRYACAVVRNDEGDSSRRSLYLDRLRHAHVDLDDPTYLDIRYIRLFADVADALPPGPLHALHIGGGGFTFPRYLAHTRPGTFSLALEIDPGVVEIAKDRLGLQTGPELVVSVTDARIALPEQPGERFDLVVGDAFSGQAVPWHLTTVEVAEQVRRVLQPDGVYVVNVIDGAPNDFARAEIATLRTQFDYVSLILVAGVVPREPRNQVIVASNAPLPSFDIDPNDGEVVEQAALDRYVGNAAPLTDDFAPVDQLVAR